MRSTPALDPRRTLADRRQPPQVVPAWRRPYGALPRPDRRWTIDDVVHRLWTGFDVDDAFWGVRCYLADAINRGSDEDLRKLLDPLREFVVALTRVKGTKDYRAAGRAAEEQVRASRAVLVWRGRD